MKAFHASKSNALLAILPVGEIDMGLLAELASSELGDWLRSIELADPKDSVFHVACFMCHASGYDAGIAAARGLAYERQARASAVPPRRLVNAA